MDLLDTYVIDGNLESIKTVINGDDWKLDSELKDYNLLKKALIYKHKEITKFFISNNFRVNKFSIYDADTTPLHIAVELEWEDIVLLLLEKGASVMVQDKTSKKLTPIQLSFFMRKYQLTDVMLPFDKGPTIPDSDINANNHLHIACARNCISVVKNYLRLGESINTCAGLNFINWLGYTPLHFAVEFQNRETVELLLKCGASITAKDEKAQNTPLHLASNLHDKSLIDLLLLEHRYITCNPNNLFKVSHFHLACTRNNTKVAYGLLQCGVDINATVENGPWKGYTALHLAVTHQCIDIVKLLLSQDNLAKDNSEIFLFNVYKTDNSEIINLITCKDKSLLATEFSGKIPLNPFFRACLKGDKRQIKALISSGVPVNEHLPLDSLLFPGATPLHILVGHDPDSMSKIIDLILKKGANVTAKDARGLTPIHLVSQKSLIELLMKVPSRFKINVSDSEGLSLFHIACGFGMNKVVDWFLDNVDVDVNAAVNEDALQYPGCTALHMAVSSIMHVEVFLKLLSHGGNIMLKNKQGLAPLDFLFQHWSVGYDDYEHDIWTIMSHLIKVYRDKYVTFDGLEFNLLHAACIVGDENLILDCTQDDEVWDSAVDSALNSACGWFSGFTPLHFAVLRGGEEIIDLMLDYCADPTIRSVEGDTPLHMSIKYLKTSVDTHGRHTEVFLPWLDESLFLLLENPFGSSGFSHFHIACQFNRLEVVNYFLKHGIDPDIRTRRTHSYEFGAEPWINETGLHAAMRFGHREVVLLLLKHGADANARDMIQRTPLHKILEDEDKSIAKLLVEVGGADVDALDSDHRTPLQVACLRDVLRPVLDGLLEAGADIDLVDKDGKTVIDHAAHMSKYSFDGPTEQLCSLVEHALRLKVAGCPISEKNEVVLAANRESVIDAIGQDFETRCSEELQRMECVRLDGRTTLRDVLRIRNADQLRLLAGNKVFKRLVDGELPKDKEKPTLDDFPRYGYLVRLQFHRGWKRRQVMPAAVLAIRKLVEMYCAGLPVECAEYFLSYLADDDLKRLSEAVE